MANINKIVDIWYILKKILGLGIYQDIGRYIDKYIWIWHRLRYRHSIYMESYIEKLLWRYKFLGLHV